MARALELLTADVAKPSELRLPAIEETEIVAAGNRASRYTRYREFTFRQSLAW